MFNILAIGQSGSGKSTYANILCNANVPESDSSSSVTGVNKFYSGNGFLYLDPIGFNDSRKRTSREISGDMMKVIYDNKEDGKDYLKINLVLWFQAAGSIRKNENLQTEAKFIHELSKYTPGDVWRNTFLILNGMYGIPPDDRWKQGAQEAARDVSRNQLLELGSFSVEIIPDKRTRPRESQEARKRIYRKIRDFANARVSSYFNIRFEMKRCKKCTFFGDYRFVNTKCHTIYDKAHGKKGVAVRFHQGDRYHSGKKKYLKSAVLGGSALGVATAGVGTLAGALGGLAYAALKDAKCKNCNKSVESSYGCMCTHCDKNWDAIGCGLKYIYKNRLDPKDEIGCMSCQRQYRRDNGCFVICYKCKRNWRTSIGCDEKADHEF